jgi:hypothetical protein
MPEPLPPCEHGVPGHYGCVECMSSPTPGSDAATGIRTMVSRLSKPYLTESGELIVPDKLAFDKLKETDFEAELIRAMTTPVPDEPPTQYTCGFRGPSPQLVVMDEAAEFPPSDLEGNDLPCDRCSSTDEVRMLTSCRDCGPVPLCARCRDAHAEEMCEDAEYDGILQRGLD